MIFHSILTLFYVSEHSCRNHVWAPSPQAQVILSGAPQVNKEWNVKHYSCLVLLWHPALTCFTSWMPGVNHNNANPWICSPLGIMVCLCQGGTAPLFLVPGAYVSLPPWPSIPEQWSSFEGSDLLFLSCLIFVICFRHFYCCFLFFFLQ